MSDAEKSEHVLCPPEMDLKYAQGDWPKKKWWEAFESPELSSLVEEALVANPSIQAITSRVQESEQIALVMRSAMFPFLSFDAGSDWSHLSRNGLYHTLNPTIPVNGDLVDIRFTLDYEFDFWGKNRNLWASAIGQAKAMQAEAAQVELVTASSIAQAYFSYLASLEKKELIDRLYQVRVALKDLQDRLEKASLVSLMPVFLSVETLEDSAKMVSQADDFIDLSRNLVNALRGKGPKEEISVGWDWGEFPSSLGLPKCLNVDLLARRPDLIASIWRAEALSHEVGAAVADFYPNISLSAAGGWESFQFSDLFNRSSIMGMLSPAIHLPIFTAGKIRANVRAKQASFDEAIYDYNQRILSSCKEVADQLSSLKSAEEQFKSQDVIVRQARARFNLSKLRFESGLDSLLTLFAVEEEYLIRQIEQVELKLQEHIAAVQLIQSLGGGYSPEFTIPIEKEGCQDE
ncbi:MAG: efflux transporter outer membrane subunit [Simkaniaceae bacterium]|nr:efflux transporter outer membrane subunit [Simkaniaceae bacterium]